MEASLQINIPYCFWNPYGVDRLLWQFHSGVVCLTNNKGVHIQDGFSTYDWKEQGIGVSEHIEIKMERKCLEFFVTNIQFSGLIL
jgi:hypothetical protein